MTPAMLILGIIIVFALTKFIWGLIYKALGFIVKMVFSVVGFFVGGLFSIFMLPFNFVISLISE